MAKNTEILNLAFRKLIFLGLWALPAYTYGLWLDGLFSHYGKSDTSIPKGSKPPSPGACLRWNSRMGSPPGTGAGSRVVRPIPGEMKHPLHISRSRHLAFFPIFD